MQICKFSPNDDCYCLTHECRIDDVDMGDGPVELRDGDLIVGEAARKYRQALHHAQQAVTYDY